MTIDDTLREAFEHHQQGRLIAAEQGYRRLLRQQPDNPQALHLFGVLQGQVGRFQGSLKSLQQALKLAPVFPEAWGNLGNTHRAMGESGAAEKAYRTAIEQSPGFVDAHYNLGTLLMDQESWLAAEVQLRQAVTLQPNHPAAWRLLGIAYAHLERWHDTVACLRQSLHYGGKDTDTFVQLAVILRKIGTPEEAESAWRVAIEHDPLNAHAITKLVVQVVDNRARASENEALLRAAIAANPSVGSLHLLLGRCLLRQGRLVEAQAAHDVARLLAPQQGDVHAYAALTMMASGQPQRALAAVEQAIQVEPDHAGIWNIYGTVLVDCADPRTGKPRLEDSIAAFDQAITLSPDYAEAHSNRGMSLLLLGKFSEGWSDYEYRWKALNFRKRHQTIRHWNGRLLAAGQTILVAAEQGYGDTINFFRYVPLLASLGVTVIFEVQAGLYRLLRYVPGATAVIVQDNPHPIPRVDGQITMLSLMGFFNTTLETIPAVLTPAIDPEYHATWRDILGPSGLFEGYRKPRIAIVWAGNAAHENDHNRSVSLSFFARILADQRFEVISLQVGPRGDRDRAAFDGQPPRSVAEHLNDFADTAAALSHMDLCLSVDTAVAHLAATLGLPTWVLLAYYPDWRWLLTGETTRWYPTMRLFRQPSHGDWASPRAAVETALEAWLLDWRSSHPV